MKKRYSIGSFIFMLFLFPTLIILLKPFWPGDWAEAAQAATLAAAITAGIVSIFGICLKFIFDQISSETKYDQKISEKMISRIHTYAEEYYVPLGLYARKSASALNDILNKIQASTEEEKQHALFFITKYFQYRLKLESDKGGIIFFQNVKSEDSLVKLGTNALKYLKLTPKQISILPKSIDRRRYISRFFRKD